MTKLNSCILANTAATLKTHHEIHFHEGKRQPKDDRQLHTQCLNIKCGRNSFFKFYIFLPSEQVATKLKPDSKRALRLRCALQRKLGEKNLIDDDSIEISNLNCVT